MSGRHSNLLPLLTAPYRYLTDTLPIQNVHFSQCLCGSLPTLPIQPPKGGPPLQLDVSVDELNSRFKEGGAADLSFALRLVAQRVIDEHQRSHRFDHGNGTGKDARIVTAARFQSRVLELHVNRV